MGHTVSCIVKTWAEHTVIALPLSNLKCFQKHLLLYCCAVIQDWLLQAGRHIVSCGRTANLALRSPAAGAFIGLVQRSVLGAL